MLVFATIKPTQFKSWLRLEQFPTAKQSQSPAPALQRDQPAAQRVRGSPAFWIPYPPPKKNMKFEQALCSIFQGCKKDPGQRYFLRGGGGVDTEICGEFFGKVQLFQWNITDGALQLHLPQRPSQTQFRVILNFPQREQLRWEPDWTHQEGSTVLALTLIGSHENNSLVTARQNK